MADEEGTEPTQHEQSVTYCFFCESLHPDFQTSPSWAWMCMRFPADEPPGFLHPERWHRDPPWRKCRDINTNGRCPWFEPRRGNPAAKPDTARILRAQPSSAD